MEAVVMQLKENKAAVLDKDGLFHIIPDRGYAVGERIDLDGLSAVPETKEKRTDIRMFVLRNISAVAAAAVVILCIGTGVVYATPCSELSLDVNPSFRYSINVFDHVLSVSAYNSDGEAFLDEINRQSRLKSTETAVSRTLDILEENGYFEEDENNVLISVSGPSEGALSRIRADLSDTEQQFNRSDKKGRKPLHIEEVDVPEETGRDARDMGVSPGRLARVRELEKAARENGEESFDEKHWLLKPVSEVDDELERQKGRHREDSSDGMDNRENSDDGMGSRDDAAPSDDKEAIPVEGMDGSSSNETGNNSSNIETENNTSNEDKQNTSDNETIDNRGKDTDMPQIGHGAESSEKPKQGIAPADTQTEPGFNKEEKRQDSDLPPEGDRPGPGFTPDNGQAEPDFTPEVDNPQPGPDAGEGQQKPPVTHGEEQQQPGVTPGNGRNDPNFAPGDGLPDPGFTPGDNKPQPGPDDGEGQHEPPVDPGYGRNDSNFDHGDNMPSPGSDPAVGQPGSGDDQPSPRFTPGDRRP